jgi:hypothetical protein
MGLTGPNGIAVRPVSPGRKSGYQSSDDKFNAAIYNGAVGGESPLPLGSHGAVIVWDGTWPASARMTLELEGEGLVNAWVEATFDDAVAAGPVYFDLATRVGTINVPATHPDLIAVGCTNNRSTWTDRDGLFHDLAGTAYSAFAPPDASCYFSSAGPTAAGLHKPDISAPGAMVAAAMSRDARPGASPFSAFSAPSGLCADGNDCLVVDERHALLSGSSMSSPQVTGAVALLLERDATLTQPEILRALQGGARRPAGPITGDYQLGVGSLDVVGAAAAIDARTAPIAREPDAAASWVSLANNYVHPSDGTPLVGHVAVRGAGGDIADGFETSRLRVNVGSDGEIAEPLTRVAAGLYRFAVRARAGTGSRLLPLDVTVDGVVIGASGSERLSGHRLIPIGADRWVAAGSARVYGGCSVASVRTRRTSGREAARLLPHHDDIFWIASLVALGLVATRRSRVRPRYANVRRYPNVPPS